MLKISFTLIMLGKKHHAWLDFINVFLVSVHYILIIHAFPLGLLFFLLNYIYFLYKAPWISKLSICLIFFYFAPLERVVRYETQLTAIFPSSLKFSGSVSQWQGANGTKGQRQQELPPNRKLRRFVRLSAYFLPEHFLIFGQLDTLWATYTSISSTPHTNMHIAPSLDHALS